MILVGQERDLLSNGGLEYYTQYKGREAKGWCEADRVSAEMKAHRGQRGQGSE